MPVVFKQSAFFFISFLQPNKREIHLIEIKYCVHTSPTQQKKAREQQKLLITHLLGHPTHV
jgi:hypothetical protein